MVSRYAVKPVCRRALARSDAKHLPRWPDLPGREEKTSYQLQIVETPDAQGFPGMDENLALEARKF